MENELSHFCWGGVLAPFFTSRLRNLAQVFFLCGFSIFSSLLYASAVMLYKFSENSIIKLLSIYTMLCQARTSRAEPWHVAPCFAMLFHAMPCYVMLWNAVMCYAMLFHAMPCHASTNTTATTTPNTTTTATTTTTTTIAATTTTDY